MLPEQVSYIHYISQTIQNALKRLPELYLHDFTVREALRLTEPEEQWLWECWGPSQRENNPIFGRLDAMIDLVSPMWKDSIKFVEPNLTGIGGLHMVPTAEGIITETMLPALDEAISKLEKIDAEQARIVELRYFAGMSVEEAAGVMGISPATLKRRWALARAWLFRELSQ